MDLQSKSSPAHDGTPHPTQQQRAKNTKRTKYIGRACQDCQRRKVKCSGEDICLNCRVRGSSCIYMPRARRGRRQRVDKAHLRTRVVENSAPQTTSQPSIQLPGHNPSPQSALEHDGNAVVPLSQGPDRIDVSLGLDDDTDAYEMHDTRPRSISLSSQLQCLRELARSNRKQPTPVPPKRNHLLNRVFPVELPRPSRVSALLDVYFRDLDSFFPFLDRLETEKRLRDTLARLRYAEDQHILDVDFRNHSTIAMLCNMIAVAECFCAADARSDDLRPGWSIFLRGRKLIQYCSSPKYVDLDLIRYHALSAEYLMQSELLHAASQAISNAVQLAMYDRLNDEQAWGNISTQEARDRKMLWWIIYFLDRKIAQRTGGPYVIRDNEVAVSDFDPLPLGIPLSTAQTYHYMQALVNQAKLWSQIWDSFFAAAAPKPADWKEIEVMDTRILMAQRELPVELTWETDLLDRVYLAQGEQELQIRRRLGIFIRLNLLRLTIRQNPLQRNERNKLSRRLCASLAGQTVEAIAAFTDSCPSIIPCGFFFSTALLECIYHLIFAIQDAPAHADRASSIESFKLSYQLLVQFSRTLDTAKRAIRALDSAVFSGSELGSLLASTEDNSILHDELPNGDSGSIFDASFLPEGGDLSHELPSYGEYDPFETMTLFPLLDDAAPDGGFQYDGDLRSPSEMEFWDMIYSSIDGTNSTTTPPDAFSKL
ncbi:hypothetical protein FE257_010472 [Aspergillus nanangensis]|uniref:Zn(2)-C6 fungal-type domain-containing protein n=1 Tax=Aspergillus nanangensis TaxID=2582783 RepID=A0AAD4GTA0_ASPNN|nr:hypothetical protein FE257_010472 [Aspergillus nanangensis]